MAVRERNLNEMGRNLQKIINRLTANQDLMKLLYFTDKDPLAHDDISADVIKREIFEKLVKIIPRVGPKETANSLVTIRVVRGMVNSDNNQFKDIEINIEVLVPMTQWFIKDDNLRPFAIMGEIQKSLNGKTIDGLGKMIGGDFDLNFLTDEISCYEVTYNLTAYD